MMCIPGRGLHELAADYADGRRAETKAYREKLGLPPYDVTGDIWLAHYEGFRSGSHGDVPNAH